MAEEIKTEIDQIVQQLTTERDVALAYQQRRHEQWNDNYTLYRDFVHTNRLTQRQAVNIPLMKETIKTILSKIDESPDIFFEILEEEENFMKEVEKAMRGEILVKEKEFTLNAFWEYDFERLKMESQDIQDKKNVLLYGRSFKKLNFVDGKFDTEVLDIYDILVDKKTNPLDIETARFIVHQNIYKPLREILANEKYTQEGRAELKEFFETEEGVVQGEQSREAAEQKAQRIKDLGGEEYAALEELLAGSDVVVSLTEHFTHLWDEKKKEFVRYVVVLAQDKIILFKKPLKEVLNIDFWPFVSWADDLEVSDFWSDGIADIVRVANKIINAWYSQLIENRTLKNYGMNFYDATNPAFIPQTYEPKPWGWYPVPGDPRKVIQRVDIPDLKESLIEIDFVVRLIERATATPPVEKGIAERRQITLGEVELLVGRAMERTGGITKFYHLAWKEFARKWYEIMIANVSPSMELKLYKDSPNGRKFAKKVKRKDIKSEMGYKVKIRSSAEHEAEKTDMAQRLMVIKREFPDNLALQKIIRKKMLDLVKLTPDEIREVTEFEERRVAPAEPRIPTPPVALPGVASGVAPVE